MLFPAAPAPDPHCPASTLHLRSSLQLEIACKARVCKSAEGRCVSQSVLLIRSKSSWRVISLAYLPRSTAVSGLHLGHLCTHPLRVHAMTQGAMRMETRGEANHDDAMGDGLGGL